MKKTGVVNGCGNNGTAGKEASAAVPEIPAMKRIGKYCKVADAKTLTAEA